MSAGRTAGDRQQNCIAAELAERLTLAFGKLLGELELGLRKRDADDGVSWFPGSGWRGHASSLLKRADVVHDHRP